MKTFIKNISVIALCGIFTNSTAQVDFSNDSKLAVQFRANNSNQSFMSSVSPNLAGLTVNYRLNIGNSRL